MLCKQGSGFYGPAVGGQPTDVLLRSHTPRWGSTAQSVGASLKLPRCFEGILNGAIVASGEVSDNHHVLDVSGPDAANIRRYGRLASTDLRNPGCA